MPTEQELIAQRLEKRQRLLALGDPYPPRVQRTHTTVEVASTLLYFTGSPDWDRTCHAGMPLICNRNTQEALVFLGWARDRAELKVSMESSKWLVEFDQYIEDLNILSDALKVEPDRLQRLLESVSRRQVMANRYDAWVQDRS